MTAVLAPTSAPKPSAQSLPEKLVGWKAIGDALGVAPEIAMRWHLKYRLPVKIEQREVGKRGKAVRRVTARRSELVTARAAFHDVAAPLPRLLSKRLALPRELLAEHFPELVDVEPRDVAAMVGPRTRDGAPMPYRVRVSNLVDFAPLLSDRQKNVFHAFLRRMPSHGEFELYVDMLTVPWLAGQRGVHDRTVQRHARELAALGLLEIEDNVRNRTGRRRRKPECANTYRVPLITCALLKTLGYRLTPSLLAAIADLDPVAEARLAALREQAENASSSSAEPHARPNRAERRKAAKEAPREAPSSSPAPSSPELPSPTSQARPAKPAPIDADILRAIERETRLDGLTDGDLVKIDRARILKGLRVEETLCAIWYTLSVSDKRARGLVGPICKYIGVQKPVTDEQVVQAFLSQSAMRCAASDVGFAGRLVTKYARENEHLAPPGAGLRLLGRGGLLDVLRRVEDEGFPADGDALRRRLRDAVRSAPPPE